MSTKSAKSNRVKRQQRKPARPKKAMAAKTPTTPKPVEIKLNEAEQKSLEKVWDRRDKVRGALADHTINGSQLTTQWQAISATWDHHVQIAAEIHEVKIEPGETLTFNIKKLCLEIQPAPPRDPDGPSEEEEKLTERLNRAIQASDFDEISRLSHELSGLEAKRKKSKSKKEKAKPKSADELRGEIDKLMASGNYDKATTLLKKLSALDLEGTEDHPESPQEPGEDEDEVDTIESPPIDDEDADDDSEDAEDDPTESDEAPADESDDGLVNEYQEEPGPEVDAAAMAPANGKSKGAQA